MNVIRASTVAAIAAGAMLLPVPIAASAAQATVATPWVETHAARIRLVAGADARQPGKSFLAGVEVAMADGWKTYWRNPGEAGVPPNFDWSGSTNTASIKVMYPAPVRIADPAAEMIGYKNSVMFPVEVIPAAASESVNLRLALELGVCREICIPAQVSLDLPVPASLLQGKPAPEVAAAVDRVPRSKPGQRPGDPRLQGVTANLEGPSPNLQIEASFPGGASGADLFIEGPDGIYVPMARKLPGGTDGKVRFTVDLSRGGDAADLKGKTLTLTLVGSTGASEATWKVQ